MSNNVYLIALIKTLCILAVSIICIGSFILIMEVFKDYAAYALIGIVSIGFYLILLSDLKGQVK